MELVFKVEGEERGNEIGISNASHCLVSTYLRQLVVPLGGYLLICYPFIYSNFFFIQDYNRGELVWQALIRPGFSWGR